MFIEDIVRHNDYKPLVLQDALLPDALAAMTRSNDGVVFIVDGNRHLVGILTDGDVRRTAERRGILSELPVASVMTRTPVSIRLHTTVVEAFSVMKQREISVLPVVAEDGTFLDYVRLHDVAAVLSPERIYPTSLDAASDENLQKHFSRYAFAAQFMLPGFRVLDAACGSGYGSRMLAQKAASVVGVDISEESIAFARLNHALPNVEYRQQSIEHLEFPDHALDAVVTLETLEHVEKPVCVSYLERIQRWLKPGGVIVASAPMLRFRDGRPFVTNPYHVNELPRDELIGMLQTTLHDFTLHFYHQKIDVFLPLTGETEGFCVVVGRKRDA